MARTKSNPKHPRMIRFALVCVAWTLWLFVVLSCVSYHSEDNFWRGGLAMVEFPESVVDAVHGNMRGAAVIGNYQAFHCDQRTGGWEGVSKRFAEEAGADYD